MVVHNANSGNWKLNVIIPLVMSVVCLVLAIIAPFAYDDQKKASEGKKDKSDNAVQAAMLVKPNKFIVFLVMFYAFLCMAIMYGAQQYTKSIWTFRMWTFRDSGSRYDFYLYNRVYLCSTFPGVYDGKIKMEPAKGCPY